MKHKTLISIISIIAIILFSFFVPVGRYFTIAKNIEIFSSIFKEINLLYVEETNPNEIMKNGIDAMLESLDPYTNFISEEDVEDYRTLNTGQYAGIGAVTQTMEKRTMVTMIYNKYPAKKNGLKIGDEIIKIGNIKISQISTNEISQLMKGQIDTPIHLTIKRMGMPKLLHLHFIRQKIKINNISYRGMLGHDIGYIRLINFTSKASKEVENAIVYLKKNKAKSLILDLRGNPGGLLIEAINICSLFLPLESLIVTTKGRGKHNNTTYNTKKKPLYLHIPLIILINQKSASASEIVAGSLQDYDRAVILGEKSFGKGLVQLSRPLPYNAQLKLTTAKYYTPTGRCIQALDYSHQQENGTILSTPDSLKQEFKTPHGRSVYDGRGIKPDSIVTQQELSQFSQRLYSKGYILEYATLYAINHPYITTAKKFRLNKEEYDEFKKWIRGKSYIFVSPTIQKLNSLKKIAKKKHYLEASNPLFNQLEKKIEKIEKNNLSKFETEIKYMLEENIVSQYYFKAGAVSAQLQHDSTIALSIKIFRDSLIYKNILTKL